MNTFVMVPTDFLELFFGMWKWILLLIVFIALRWFRPDKRRKFGSDTRGDLLTIAKRATLFGSVLGAIAFFLSDYARWGYVSYGLAFGGLAGAILAWVLDGKQRRRPKSQEQSASVLHGRSRLDSWWTFLFFCSVALGIGIISPAAPIIIWAAGAGFLLGLGIGTWIVVLRWEDESP